MLIIARLDSARLAFWNAECGMLIMMMMIIILRQAIRVRAGSVACARSTFTRIAATEWVDVWPNRVDCSLGAKSHRLNWK